MRFERVAKIAGLTVALVTTAASARAQGEKRPSTADQLLAESLFSEGRALMDQGRFPEACAKLAESQRLDPGGGTLLNLAVCHEKEGKLGTAYVELNAALAQATKDDRKDRAEVARGRLAAITPRLPRLAVRVIVDQPDLEVTVDGAPLRRPAWGVATVVDPGPHLVLATAPGKVTFSVTIGVATAEKRTVDVPALASATGEANATSATGGIGSAQVPRADLDAPKARSSSNSAVRTAAAVVAATGLTVAGIAASIWLPFTLTRRAGCDDARRYCTDSGLAALKVEQPVFWTAAVSAGLGTAGFIVFLAIPQGSGLAAAPTQGGARLDFTTRF